MEASACRYAKGRAAGGNDLRNGPVPLSMNCSVLPASCRQREPVCALLRRQSGAAVIFLRRRGTSTPETFIMTNRTWVQSQAHLKIKRAVFQPCRGDRR